MKDLQTIPPVTKKLPFVSFLVVIILSFIMILSGCVSKQTEAERKRFKAVWEVIAGRGDDFYVIDDVAARFDEGGQPTNDTSGQQALRISSKGTLKGKIGPAVIEGPAAIDSRGNITFAAGDSVRRLNNQGKAVPLFKRPRSLESLRPISIAVSDGAVYVVYSSDLKNDVIIKLDRRGRQIGRWGVGAFPGAATTHIAAINADKSGSLYLLASADKLESSTRIEKFSSEGKLLSSFEAPYGRAKGSLRLPLDIAVDDRGDIFIADAGNNRIQKFSAKGKYLTLWGNDFLFGNSDQAGPTSIAVNKYVYAGDPTRRVVYKFTLDGKRLEMWRGIR